MSKPGDWKIPNRIEQSYARSLRAISKQVETAIGNTTDPHTIVRRLKQISQQPRFREYCDNLAKKMTTSVQTQVNGTWRRAAQKASRGSDIYRAILEELKTGGIGDAFINKVFENAGYIKSFPEDIALEFSDYIQSETLKGRRASDIAGDLMGIYTDKAKSRINLIARTEVSKTQTALTQARAEKLGLSWYIWRDSDDSRVRYAHNRMDGILVNWNEPPSPELLFPQKGVKPYGSYHAGDTFNCRCYPEPIVSIDYLVFPVRVYRNGSIQNMNRADFMKIA